VIADTDAVVSLPAFATAAAVTASIAAAATTATPAIAAATATAAAVTTATATATAIALRASFVDGDRAAVDFGAVERFDRVSSIVIVCHRYESESAWAARVTIRDHCHFFYLAVGPKFGLQRFLGRRKGKVANIQLHRAQLQNTEPVQNQHAGFRR
jgi:hypothetical protein